MPPRPERPRTAAGRRILDDPVVFMPHSKEWARQCIVAAEAEAARAAPAAAQPAPLDVLRDLYEAAKAVQPFPVGDEESGHVRVQSDRLTALYDAAHAAQTLLAPQPPAEPTDQPRDVP